jgi:hypothetical protein
MPIAIKGTSPEPIPVANPWGDGAFVRVWTLTDKDGVVHKINSSRDLERILAQMTPEELALWKDRLRFEPVYNDTGIIDYTGTLRDLA